ncbi:unnamed protein product [Allacma fusca]|uniref:Uncharacterized protein n=1 Tax=Allacma fusca TaxID=39272 RepID=A0A8J2PEJ8_9HEXA|nr:unnamed protein product [Allacma fusca]
MNVHFDEAEFRTPNHIFWQTDNPCHWWNDPLSAGDPLRQAVEAGGNTAIICSYDGGAPIINYDMLLSLNFPMDLVSDLMNFDTGNTGFCLEYSQRQ